MTMTRLTSHSCSFGDFNINAIENTSGIFIGETQANEWSFKSKNNQAIGELRDSQVEGLIGILQDNDKMDMTNVDNTVFIKRTDQNEKNLTKIDVKVNGVNINNLSLNSSVAIGENQQDFWSAESKNNYGTGKLVGYNKLQSVINNLDDKDLIDHYAPVQSRQVSVQNQSE